jgi:hypothetical protein
MTTRRKTERDHGPEWLVEGDEGAVSFFIYNETPAAIGIHRTTPPGSRVDCEYLPGGFCYADATFTHGKELFDHWQYRKSDDVIWAELEKWYDSHVR